MYRGKRHFSEPSTALEKLFKIQRNLSGSETVLRSNPVTRSDLGP
jgi:hypothetical protein